MKLDFRGHDHAVGATGDALSGAWGTEIVKGMVKGSTVSLALTDTAGRDAGTLTGKIEGDAGGGVGTMAGVGGRGGRLLLRREQAGHSHLPG